MFRYRFVVGVVLWWWLPERTAAGRPRDLPTTTTAVAAVPPAADRNSLIRESTVLVIGAGPAGLATALALSQVCRRVVVVEQHSALRPRGASLGIMPNGLRALMELCPAVVREMKKTGVPIRIPGDRTPRGVLLPWFEVRDILARHVRRRRRTTQLRLGHAVAQLEERPDGVTVSFTNTSQPPIHADFVVACDGTHSVVRQHLGLKPAVRDNKATVYRGVLQLPPRRRWFGLGKPSLKDGVKVSEKLRNVMENGGITPIVVKKYDGFYFFSLSYHRKRRGLFTWLCTTHHPLHRVDETPWEVCQRFVTDDDETLAILREILALSSSAPWNDGTQKPIPGALVMDFSEVYLAQLQGGWGGRGRITLLGDAAHAMKPTDGQGANQAFEDAVVLARTLRRAATEASSSTGSGGLLEQALRTFEQTRVPRVKRIHDHQRKRAKEWMGSAGRGLLDPEMQEFIYRGV